MRYGLLVIVLAVQGVLLMLFTATGNDMSLPYVNSYLKSNISEAKIELKEYRLGFDTLTFSAKMT